MNNKKTIIKNIENGAISTIVIGNNNLSEIPERNVEIIPRGENRSNIVIPKAKGSINWFSEGWLERHHKSKAAAGQMQLESVYDATLQNQESLANESDSLLEIMIDVILHEENGPRAEKRKTRGSIEWFSGDWYGRHLEQKKINAQEMLETRCRAEARIFDNLISESNEDIQMIDSTQTDGVPMSKGKNEDAYSQFDDKDKQFISSMWDLLKGENFDKVETAISQYFLGQIQLSNSVIGQLLIFLTLAQFKQGKVNSANVTIKEGLALKDLSPKVYEDLKRLGEKINSSSLKRQSERSNDEPSTKKLRVTKDSISETKASETPARNMPNEIEQSLSLSLQICFNQTLSLLQICFNNKCYQEAEAIAEKALKMSFVKEDRIKLNFALAKACLMQLESNHYSEQLAKAEYALQEAITGKRLTSGAASFGGFYGLNKYCEFYLNLSIECLKLSEYKKAEIIAKLGVIINQADYIKAELSLALSMAYFFQGQYAEAKYTGVMALDMEFIQENTRRNITFFVNEPKKFMQIENVQAVLTEMTRSE